MDKKYTFIQDILEAIWIVGFDKDKPVTTNLEEIPQNNAKVPNPGKQFVIELHTAVSR